MFQQGKRIQNLNEDHQGTRLLLDNHLLRLECRNLDVDGHIGIINSRIDRRRRDVASLEQRLDDLEAASALLTTKVTAMEPHLCHCGREEQPIVVEDGEREESSPSSYQTPPVASPNENQEPIPVRILTMREGQLIPVVEQEEINELFQAIYREREADHNDQEELSVRTPNHQRRRIWVRHRAQLHMMSTAVNIQPRVPLRRIEGIKGAVRIDPFECIATSTVSTMSLERRSVERNVESAVTTTPRLNLDWIASWTMTRLQQVAILFLVCPWQESLLQHVAESTFMLTPDDIRGRLTEMPRSPGLVSDFTLELTIPLLDEKMVCGSCRCWLGIRWRALIGKRVVTKKRGFEWLKDLIQGR